ncbi:MAG: tRNA lysidine(34) synthetase TilS [Planctomycetales bacterium]|nr:tRNA lysidine(34) synthetase TilS [Planctomycetales bacterium]
MRHPVEMSLIGQWPVDIWGNTRVLVAVSGGADSVALLRGMLRLTPNPKLIEVAHFDHCWRAEESDGDAQFVAELCATLDVRFTLERADACSPASSVKRSEQAARQLRYDFLIKAAYRAGARYVVCGHTASDRAETLLHNLFRGTGLRGAAGPAKNRNLDEELVLVRPLLACTRPMIEDYLRQLEQPYRTDSSNADASYRRNYLRNVLLPAVREAYGEHVESRLISFSELAAEANAVLKHYAQQYWCQVESQLKPNHANVIDRNSAITFPHFDLLPTPWPVVHQAIQSAWQERRWALGDMTLGHWNQIRQVYESQPSEIASPAITLPGQLRLDSVAGWVQITS